MENSYSAKRALIAVLLVFVLAFSIPINIAAPRTAIIGNFPFAQNNTDASFLNAEIPSETSDSTKNVISKPEINTSNNYKPEESIFVNNNLISSDEILSYSDNNINIIETHNEYSEEQGVSVIPATLNNIMRDNLPSIITKKAYTFSLSSRGAIVYAFNHVTTQAKNCLWYITLYEEYSPDGTGTSIAYRALNSVTYESTGTGVQSVAIGVLPGNYRLEVECVSGFTNEKYDILIGFVENSFYEAEPNNTISRYTQLPLNKTINGSASVFPQEEADTDCYLFKITDTGYTVVYFEHEADAANSASNVAWRITLTDEYGNEYFYTTSTMEKTMINSGVIGLPPGYYFLTVNSHIYSSVPYSLNISFTSDTAVEAELNDTPETANEIEINTEMVGSLSSRNDTSDKDHFSFTLENDGFIVIDFIHEAMTTENEGWNISVFSSSGRLVFSAVSDWSQAVVQSPNIGLTAGDYYIKIDSDNLYHNSMVYRLFLLTEQNTNWETEPNNIPGDADIIEIGNSVNGTMVESGVDYDKDWYSVTAEKEGKINISFGHITTDEADKEGWIISLIDRNGNVIATLSSDWDEEEKAISANVIPGNYYILVETGLFFNSNRYILTVTAE